MTISYNPFTLKGKTILVTGASSGIGKAIAIECSKMGANLIISGRNEHRLDETLRELATKDFSTAIATDLSLDDNIKHLIDNLPKLDGIVMSTGIVEMIPVLFATQDKFEKIYKTNLFSPIELLRSIIKKKKFNPGLSVVVIDSVAGTRDINIANSIYGSGKAALLSFMKYAALELSPKNIRINTISPGMILTPMHTQGVVEEEKLEQAVSNVPLKRWGIGKDIAFGAVYLLSDASSYVTGTDLCIDGGLTI